jgi:hypothetical protein
MLLSIPAVLHAAPPEMQSIDQFLAANLDNKTGVAEVHLGLRCSSLFSVMQRFTADNHMQKEADRFNTAADAALEFAFEYQNPKNNDYLAGQLKIMLEAYVERFLISKARTGNFSDDKIISDDLRTCSNIF